MIDPTRIIMDARNLRNSIFFSCAEIKFVLQFPTLSDGAKCLWLFLAHHSAKDPSLTCTMSLYEMAQGLARSPEMIRTCLSQLQRMGFLSCFAQHSRASQDKLYDEMYNNPLLQEEEFAASLESSDLDTPKAYTLTLPNAGLLELKTAILAELPSRRLFSKEDAEIIARHKKKMEINLMKTRCVG